MTKRMVFAVLLLAVICALIIRDAMKGGPSEGVAVGLRAPGFHLLDLEGREVSLDQFKGKIVMLDFWATWCGPCRLTMPLLEELQREHPNDFTLLAVNLGEDRDMVIPYVKRRNIQARVLLDSDGTVGAAYRSSQIPMQVLIDQNGIIRHIQQGFYESMKDDLWAEISKLQ